jgi:hypothetical protein
VGGAGGGAYRQGSGRPGAPAPGAAFRPTRDLAAKRDAYAGGARSGSFGGGSADDSDDADDIAAAAFLASSPASAGAPVRVPPRRPIVPGERQYRDGDRVHHARLGDGIVVSSKLTRDDEEVTVAFRDEKGGPRTLLASMAHLDIIG